AAGLFVLLAAAAHYWHDQLSNPRGAWAPSAPAALDSGAIGLVAAAAGLGLLVRAKCLGEYVVLTGSMLPTLEPGDQVLGERLAPGLRRGDIIMFRSSAVQGLSSAVPDVLAKRILGLPGDLVGMHAGVPTINGWEVPSCDAGDYLYVLPDGSGGAFHGRARVEFLENRAYLTVRAAVLTPFPEAYEVKPGEVFVLGDNRNNSFDSRSWNGGRGGGVPLAAIEARARVFLFGTHRDGSLDLGLLFRPIDRSRVHMEGLDMRPLAEGIGQCLRQRPAETWPPAAGASRPPPSEARGGP
ncbi:MAG: signal peptidase I, partial [Polyangiaceae bacterium]